MLVMPLSTSLPGSKRCTLEAMSPKMRRAFLNEPCCASGALLMLESSIQNAHSAAGTLIEALGKNRSFISQIANPAYSTPVPVQHLEIIFHICHFSPAEKRDFLSAYRAAHPGRLEAVDATRATRAVTLELPDFGNVQMNRRVDDMIHSLVRGINELFLENAESDLKNPREDTK